MPRILRQSSTTDILLLAALIGTALLLMQGAYLGLRTAVLPIAAPQVFLPLDDFHAVEQFPDGRGEYRWTRGSSSMALPNPGGRAVVRLLLAGGAGRTVPVTIQAEQAEQTEQTEQASAALQVGPEARVYRLLLPMPQSERFTLSIAAPVIEARNRTLGVVVGDIALSGGGASPLHVALALVLATVSGYLLLRRAGLAPLAAAGSVLGVQVVAVLWQSVGGWRYALFGPLMLLITSASLGAILLEHWARAEPLPGQPARPRLALPAPWLLLAVLVLALAVRLPWLGAPDPVGDMELAARRMWLLDMHGLAGAYLGNGDYMPLRLYLLRALSSLVLPLGGDFHEPLPTITKSLIKLPGLLADLATIAIIYGWSLRWLQPRRAAALAALYACAPPVWMNVAWWGQVDTLLMLPLVAMVALLERARGRWSWLCWTVALLIKPQAIVLAPLLYMATIRLHGSRGVAQGGALALALFALACLPLVLAGQGPGLMQAYLGSVGRFPMLTAGAYNLWYLVTGGSGTHDTGQGIGGVSYHHMGLLLTGGVALLVGGALLRRADGPQCALGAAVLALAFFALPTQIHERYLFLALAFLALRCASDERLVLAFVWLAGSATLNILGDLDGFIPLATRFIEASALPTLLAVGNLGVLLVLLAHLLLSRQPATSRQPETRPDSRPARST